MKILTDENIYTHIATTLRKLGHDVLDIKEQDLSGLSDTEFFSLAQREKRIIVTLDYDFTNILVYPPGSHQGIIFLKLFRLNIKDATKRFNYFIRRLSAETIRGNLVIIEPHQVRMYHK